MKSDQYKKVFKCLKKAKLPLSEIANKAKVSQRETMDLIKEMKAEGFDIAKKCGAYYLQTRSHGNKFVISKRSKGTVERRKLLTSDFHINSYHCKEDAIGEIPGIAKDMGVDKVWFAGDLTEGNGRMYRGQMHEIKYYGLEDMIEYIDATLPHGKLTWQMISGNHDDSITDTHGMCPIKRLSKERDDIEYLGRNVADIVEDGINFRILHPEGGGAYALTYEVQKYIRNLNKDQMPDILVTGHKHVFAAFDYQGVHCIMVPSMMMTNPYLARKGIDSQQGVVDLKYTVKNGKVKSIETRVIDLSGKK